MSELDRLKNTLHAHGTSHQLITAGAAGNVGLQISLFRYPRTSITVTFLHRAADGHLDVLDSEAGLLAQKVKAGDAFRIFSRRRKEVGA